MAASPEPQIHLTIDETDARGLVVRITIDHPSHLNILNTALSAAEAVHCGLVACVVPRTELDSVVERWTHAILQAGPHAVRLQKALLQNWAQLPLEQAIERGIASFSEAYRTAEPRALMTQFLQRARHPTDAR